MNLKNKKILATGLCGFIGNALGPQLIASGAQDLVVIDRMDFMSNKSFYDKNGIPVRKKDICDESEARFISEYKPDIIIHMAADSHVDRSITNPDDFVKSNVFGTVNLLNASVKMEALPLFVQVSCYDEQTRALTQSGYKRYDEIKVGDLVLSINPDTSIVEWKPVEKVIIQDYSGRMINFKSRSMNICVTPNHRMLVRDSDGNMRWYTAEEQSHRESGTLPLGKVDEFDESISKDLLFLIGVYIGDGHCHHGIRKIKNKSGLNKVDFISRRDSNGRFIKRRTGDIVESEINSYRVFLEVPEGDKCRARLEETLERLNINHSRYKKNIYIGTKKWYDFFIQFGTGAFNKKIPNEYMTLSLNELNALFDGLMMSDGSRKKSDGYQYTTVSELLAGQVATIAAQLGWKITSSLHTTSGDCYINGRRLKQGSAYYLCLSRNYENLINKKYATDTEYNGKIWCLKVKDNKNFLTERCGKFTFCGNTDEVYGDNPSGWSHEDDARKASSPYSASKASAELFTEAYGRTYNLPYVITRSSNNYGPFQHYEKFIPKVISNILNGHRIPVYGNGLQERDWIYVDDNASAIMSIINSGVTNDVFNIGGFETLTNLQIINEVCNLMNVDPSDYIEFVSDRPGHDKRYAISIEKIKQFCGWVPTTKLSDGLMKTIEWNRNRFCLL